MARSSRLSGGQRTALSATGVAGLCGVGALIVVLILPSETEVVRNAQRALATVAAPVIQFFSLPGQAVDGITSFLTTSAQLRTENQALRQDNEELQVQIQRMTQIQFENEQLRQLLSMDLSSNLVFQGAEVLADLESPFSRTVLLDAGADEGVEMGQAVLGAHGFYGRIIAVGSGSSRVLLATDFNSHIPVVIGAAHIRAILTGTSSGDPVVEYVLPETVIKEGDLVQTSGDGGQIPAGLLVGQVASVEGENIRVRLAQSDNAASFVRILRKSVPLTPEVEVGGLGSVSERNGRPVKLLNEQADETENRP